MIKKVILAVMCTPTLIYGNLNKDLNNFFRNFGSSSNIDNAEIYSGQKAGYATGGGFTLRNRVVNSQLVSVNLPSFDAGCGGIDIFSGGFSFINKQQLVNTLKSIGSSAVSYSFLLGLETVSPQIANGIKQLQTWMNDINSMNINSCEAGATLAGSVWPQQREASQHVCKNIGTSLGGFSDFVSARHNCSDKQSYREQISRISNSEYEDMYRDEYNIAWEAIQKQRFLSENKELAEFFMSLTGTLIVKQEGDKTEIIPWPSKIQDESFLQTLMDGGSANVYHCSKRNQCLSLHEKSITISEKESWVGKITSVLRGMQEKIELDEELNKEEQEFLSKTRLPLYKIVNVLTAYKKGHCPVDLLQVADLVAMDLLIQYLREVIETVREGTYQLRRESMYANEIDNYLNDLDRIERSVRYYETRNMNQLKLEFQDRKSVV